MFKMNQTEKMIATCYLKAQWDHGPSLSLIRSKMFPERFRSLHGEHFVKKGGQIQRLYGLGARMSCETYMRVLGSCPVPWHYSHIQGNS